ncbi:MAG: glycosyltransferase family A protein [Candidatus Caldarchaeum sp.]
MTTVWCSIIIPTLVENPLTLNSLPEEGELKRQGVELIIVHDRWGMRNASRSRNIGAAVAKGIVLCFIDDDVRLSWQALHTLLIKFRELNGRVIWKDPPHVLVINAAVFFASGGYDERFKPTMGETVEFKLRLKKMGLSIDELDCSALELQHLNIKPNPRYLLNQKHLTWAYLEHREFPVWRLFLRKNPIETTRRLKWILEWLLYRRWISRSIFTR